MSIKTLVNPTPDGESGVVSSLSDIKARLAKRRERDLSKLPTHYHEALGTIHIGFLPADGYHAIEAADMRREEFGIGTDHQWPDEDIKKFQDNKRDRAYLKYGVITGDNQRLDNDVVELLLSGDFGAENRKLINAIQKQNPPRENLVDELRVSHAFNRMTCILFRILERAGCLEKVRDFLLADPESVEAKILAEDLGKWEATLPAWEVYLEAEDAAKHYGIGVYDRLKIEAADQAE